jgi:hypothetical protein
MIIGPESILRRVPSALNRVQSLYIQGIRLSIELADLAHQRLIQTLLDASEAGDTAEVPTALAMSDAWSIVDYIHRLRNLLRRLPAVKHKDRIVEYRRFKNNSAPVTTLRNSIQHLENDFVKTAADTGWAVFGTLT